MVDQWLKPALNMDETRDSTQKRRRTRSNLICCVLLVRYDEGLTYTLTMRESRNNELYVPTSRSSLAAAITAHAALSVVAHHRRGLPHRPCSFAAPPPSCLLRPAVLAIAAVLRYVWAAGICPLILAFGPTVSPGLKRGSRPLGPENTPPPPPPFHFAVLCTNGAIFFTPKHHGQSSFHFIPFHLDGGWSSIFFEFGLWRAVDARRCSPCCQPSCSCLYYRS